MRHDRRRTNSNSVGDDSNSIDMDGDYIGDMCLYRSAPSRAWDLTQKYSKLGDLK